MSPTSGRGVQVARLSAGLIDAGLASLGTFLVGAYATRYLTPAELGAFAVFQSALFLAAVLPAQGTLLPAEAAALGLPDGQRLAWLRSTIVSGLPLALIASTSVLIAVALTPGTVGSEAVLALAVTAAAGIILSPLQDHLRRMMHLAKVSHRAAFISGTYCAAALVALILLHALDVPAPWIPLGALTIANAVSLVVGVGLSANRAPAPESAPGRSPRLSELWQSGRWLVFAGGISPLASFVTVLLITGIAGAEAMGNAEAARVVAQPIFVFGVGMASVVGPRSMEAGREGSGARARQLRRKFTWVNVAFTIPYMAIFGWDSPLNPLTEFFATAYVISGLVALQIAGNLIWMLTRPMQAELVGAHAERRLTVAQAIGNSVQPVTALSSALIGAVAKPISDLVSGIAAYVAQRIEVAKIYRSDTSNDT
ncbi:MAG TPA: hypothetical protein VFP42_06765 [Acidimicrobiia bacterium]|nr:hypothetical protein [Acidimicrobiia bacterium]